MTIATLGLSQEGEPVLDTAWMGHELETGWPRDIE